MTEDLKEQIRKAQAEMATWSEDKRKSIRLEGTDLWLSNAPPDDGFATFTKAQWDSLKPTQGADARPVAMTNGSFHCPACGETMKGPLACGHCLWQKPEAVDAEIGADGIATRNATPVVDARPVASTEEAFERASHCRNTCNFYNFRQPCVCPAPSDQAGEHTTSWQALFDKVALALNCLPSSFVDGNDHVFRAIEKLIATRDAVPIVDATLSDALAEIERLNAIINTPHSDDFMCAVSIEAEHQRQRWPAEGDAGKMPADWFWLVGYLAGKALHSHAAGNVEKSEHHIITTAAACANWHLALFGKTDMRPGHEEGIGLIAASAPREET